MKAEPESPAPFQTLAPEAEPSPAPLQTLAPEAEPSPAPLQTLAPEAEPSLAPLQTLPPEAENPVATEAPDKPALHRAKAMPVEPETPQNPSLLNTPKGKTPKRGHSRSPGTEGLLNCEADDSMSWVLTLIDLFVC